MKATIRDLEALRSIKPLELAGYLRSQNWKEDVEGSVPQKASLWKFTINGGREFEILLPLDQELRDFHFRISEVLATLEIVENRSQLQILHDLTTTAADIVRIRAEHVEATNGSIPL